MTIDEKIIDARKQAKAWGFRLAQLLKIQAQYLAQNKKTSPRGRKPIDSAIIEKARLLLEHGEKIDLVARKLNISERTLRKHCFKSINLGKTVRAANSAVESQSKRDLLF